MMEPLPNPRPKKCSTPRPRTILIALAVLVPCFLWLRDPGEHKVGASSRSLGSDQKQTGDAITPAASRFYREPGRTSEQIVAQKVADYARNRRTIVQRLSFHHKKAIPAEIEEFFDAVESGNWAEIDRRFQAMAKRSAQYEGSTHDAILDPFWPAVLETYGAAEQAKLWPAKQLLDYGEAILGSLRPGMVYIGGTDSGRFIPSLINETSGGDQHIVLTQNALADSRYQEYIRILYGDRLQLPSPDDSNRVFQEYVADAEKRLAHDEQFPDEPKQIRPGENVKKIDNKMDVGGPTAVMDINERLVKQILEKNPDLGFALQESFPFKNTYAEAAPLGPVMELRAENSHDPAYSRAESSLEYWRTMKETLLDGPDSARSDEALMAWSKMAVGQANLLAHTEPPHAEEAFRLATEIFPRNTDAIIGLSQHLYDSGRAGAAREVVSAYAQQHPDLKKDLERFLPREVTGW
jgi:hypothetical protein